MPVRRHARGAAGGKGGRPAPREVAQPPAAARPLSLVDRPAADEPSVPREFEDEPVEGEEPAEPEGGEGGEGGDMTITVDRDVKTALVAGAVPGAVVNRLEAMSKLTDDWDGYGSPAPEEQTLIASLEVLSQFMPTSVAAPAVAPTTTGGVQFEWHQGGWDIEVEVFPDGRAVAWGENHNTQETFYGPVEESRQDLMRHLEQLTANAAS